MAKGTTWKSDIAKDQLKDEAYLVMELEGQYKDALDECQGILQKLYDRIAKEGMTPSIMNQLKYQTALRDQIEGIYNDMYGTYYNTIADYIKKQYEGGLLQSMYSLHSQGLDISVPIDQNEIALMAKTSPYDGIKLSKKLYQNVYDMAQTVKEEMTRGLITQSSYADIARNIQKRSQQSFNKAYRIARTEGHRVNQQARMEAMGAAKSKGADIIKQWDSTLDGRTRQTHRQLDGQVREIDGKFKVGNHEAFYPGGFGIPGEDIHCRCTVLERPRWALDDSDDVSKWDGTNGELLQSQAEIDLWKDANNWPNEKGNKYNQFKKAYTKKAKKAAQQAPDPYQLSPEDEKQLKDYEDELKLLEAENDELDKHLALVDEEQEYLDIWKDPVTVADWKTKKDAIPKKKDYFTMMLSNTTDPDKHYKFNYLLDELDAFDTEGDFYWSTKDKIDANKKKIQELKDKIAALKNKPKTKALQDELDTLQEELKQFDTGKKYSPGLGEEWTLDDWEEASKDPYEFKDLQQLIKDTKSTLKEDIKIVEKDLKHDPDDEWTKIYLESLKEELSAITEFEQQGSLYTDVKKKIKEAQEKLKALDPKSLYQTMHNTGGNIDPNCPWRSLFSDRDTADDFFRDWADRTTYSLGDDDGQHGLYQYTAGSGFMNRPLSGYDGGWGRYNFKGFGKVDWDNERSIGKKSIEGLTRLIDNTDPLTEGIVLRRGSDPGGLAGMFEGAGFSYDDIMDAIRDGSIKNFEGSVIKNHAFTSCGIAGGAGFGGQIDYTIKCPAGTKMVYAEPQSEYGRTISYGELYRPGKKKHGVGHEAEMILQRGTSFRIDKITKSGSSVKIEMTVIDQNYN